MSRASVATLLAALLLNAVVGCACLECDAPCESLWHRAFSRDKNEDAPNTLLEWQVGKKDEKNGNGKEKNGDEKNDKDKNGDEKNGKNGNGKNGNGNGDNAEERDTIATDRPDFTEASTTVGKGRIQVETGYTYFRDRNDGKTVVTQTYPEILLRMGLFAEWFELRLGQTMAAERDTSTDARPHGATDLYLGVGLGLTEQKGIWPQSRLVLQTTVPSGHRNFTAEQILPGFNFLYGWDIVEEKFTLGASTGVNRQIDDDDHYYAQFHQSFTFGVKYTPKLASFTEWFTLVPCGAVSSENRTQHYLDGGFTYLITDNFQLDIRAGVGLNRAATDFFAGSGFAFRY